MNSLNSEASIFPLRVSADLKRKDSSWERVIFSRVISERKRTDCCATGGDLDRYIMKMHANKIVTGWFFPAASRVKYLNGQV